MGSEDTVMASKCLEICQVLVSQGQNFAFSLTIGSSFSFAMDTRKDPVILETREKNILQDKTMRKKLSPSQMRRNAKRKEQYLKRKFGYSKSDEQEQEVKTFKCDQCQNTFTTETDMKNHMDIHIEKEPVEMIEQLDGNIEIKQTEGNERKVVKTPEEWKTESDFTRKYVLSSIVDKFNYDMVCHKCHKKFFKKQEFKKHMQDEHNNEIFIDM